MVLLHKRSEYTDDDINLFQHLMDDFLHKYVDATRCKVVTNYICLLGSDHIRYYMEIHHNLYKYSQQG